MEAHLRLSTLILWHSPCIVPRKRVFDPRSWSQAVGQMWVRGEVHFSPHVPLVTDIARSMVNHGNSIVLITT